VGAFMINAVNYYGCKLFRCSYQPKNEDDFFFVATHCFCQWGRTGLNTWRRPWKAQRLLMRKIE